MTTDLLAPEPLTDELIERAIRRVAGGAMTPSLAQEYGVSESELHGALNSSRWADRFKQALETRSAAMQERILATLIASLESDFADIFDEDGRALPFTEWPKPLRKLVEHIEFDGIDGTVKKFRTISKGKSLELLARSQGMLKDKQDHTMEVSFSDIVRRSLAPSGE